MSKTIYTNIVVRIRAASFVGGAVSAPCRNAPVCR